MPDYTLFRRNPKLRQAYTPVSYTQEQAEELFKCSQDIYYFFENYYKVFSLDGKEVIYRPYDYQRRFIDSLLNNRFIISKQPRQHGKSITVIGYFLWKMLFNDLQRLAIIANKEDTAKALLKEFKFAYERLPKWMQQGVVNWAAHMVELENESTILASSTTGSAIRGLKFNFVLLDEFAHVPTHVAEEFYLSTYPTITAGKTSQLVIVSTPKGMNYFYELWNGAEKKTNNFVPVSVHWSEHPEHDEAWKQEQLSNLGAEGFAQEFETDFIGSTGTLIGGPYLKVLVDETANVIAVTSKNHMDVFEEPQPGHKYVVTVDVSEGVGLDYSAFHVIDITEFPYRQVAKYQNKNIHTLFYPEVIFNVANTYNKANILVEVNNVGTVVANSLFLDYEYENMLGSIIRNQRKGQELVAAGMTSGKSRLGVEMTKSVKKIGCAYLKHLIEDKKLVIQDSETVKELSTFIKRLDSYQAEEGCHDDLVTPLVIFSWACKQEMFLSLADIDIREKMITEHEMMIEHDILPFPRSNNTEDVWIDVDGLRWEGVTPPEKF